MPYQEKRAWILLGIIAITLAAYFAFISVVRFDSITLTVLAVVGFLGLRRSNRRRGVITYDERDLQIERRALVASMCVFYALVLALSMAVDFTDGGDRSVRLKMVIQTFWAISLATWGIKFLIVILMYRREAHA